MQPTQPTHTTLTTRPSQPARTTIPSWPPPPLLLTGYVGHEPPPTRGAARSIAHTNHPATATRLDNTRHCGGWARKWVVLWPRGWMCDVRHISTAPYFFILLFLIPTSPQYIARVFLYFMQKNHLKLFRLSRWRTLFLFPKPRSLWYSVARKGGMQMSLSSFIHQVFSPSLAQVFHTNNISHK